MVVAARLRRSADITRTRTDGAARGERLFALRALRNSEGAVRVAVSTQRGVGNAVKRNRSRRRLREAIRVNLRTRIAMPPVDLFFTARPTLRTAPSALIRSDVSRALDFAAQIS